MRILSLLVLTSVTLPGAGGAQQPERYTVAGDEIAIYNLAGSVTVEPGTGTATVLVTRGGPDAARLRIMQGEIDGRATLRVVYPADRVVYQGMGAGSSTDLRVRSDGTFGRHNLHGNHHDHDDEGDGDRAGRRVRLVGAGEGLEGYADLRIALPAGHRASVYLAVGRMSVANVDGRLAIDAHNAPVTATGTSGSLRIDVGSGRVSVTRARGELSVDTGSGPVEVSDFEGSELSVDTGSGDIRLNGASAPRLSLETGSGSVTAELRVAPALLSVETGSGNVAITAPAGLGAQVDIETGSGDIESDFALQVTRHSRDHLVGQVGDGRGKISIETGSGDVRLLRRAS